MANRPRPRKPPRVNPNFDPNAIPYPDEIMPGPGTGMTREAERQMLAHRAERFNASRAPAPGIAPGIAPAPGLVPGTTIPRAGQVPTVAPGPTPDVMAARAAGTAQRLMARGLAPNDAVRGGVEIESSPMVAGPLQDAANLNHRVAAMRDVRLNPQNYVLPGRTTPGGAPGAPGVSGVQGDSGGGGGFWRVPDGYVPPRTTPASSATAFSSSIAPGSDPLTGRRGDESADAFAQRQDDIRAARMTGRKYGDVVAERERKKQMDHALAMAQATNPAPQARGPRTFAAPEAGAAFADAPAQAASFFMTRAKTKNRDKWQAMTPEKRAEAAMDEAALDNWDVTEFRTNRKQ